MRDDRTLSERIAADLAAVDWQAPEEIRARARRRTRRTLLAVPATVVLTVVTVWAGAGVLRGDAQPPLPPAATLKSTPEPAPTASGGESAALDDTIQYDALLQPEDVGPEYELNGNQYRNAPGENPSWILHAESCPSYAKLGFTAWRGYLHQVGHWLVRRGDDTGIRDIAVKAERFPRRDAAQLVQDVRRVVQACPEFGLGNSEAAGPDRPAETWMTYEVLKTDFAGDSSVLVRSVAVPRDLATRQQFGVRVVTLIAFVQVGDLVTTVSWYEGTPEQMTVLAQSAVPRLCTAAKPRC